LIVMSMAFTAVFINAAMPRYAKFQTFLVMMPFLASTAASTGSYMALLLLQGPLWMGGMFLIIEKSYQTIANLIHAQERIAYLALKDPLTGLGNRAQLMAVLADAQEARKSGSSLSPYLLFLDLDGFKRVNDTFGHSAGDELLQSVASRLKDSVRPGDVIGRLGGDEFLVILNDSEPEQIKSIAQRIVDVIAKPFELSSASNVRIGASIGGSVLNDGGASHALAQADEMLYAAKHAGKGVARLSCL
jgi:diguanylate cyclase (GGDEF)-like protein